MKRILFVCTGNICRSPTAEAVFNHKLKASGQDKRIESCSAGIYGYHVGEAPDQRSQDMATSSGVDMGAQRASKVEIEDFNDYDLILAMDKGHFIELERIKPQDSSAQIDLFLNFHPSMKGMDVPDPYYSDQKAFQRVFEMIDQGCEGLVKHLTD